MGKKFGGVWHMPYPQWRQMRTDLNGLFPHLFPMDKGPRPALAKGIHLEILEATADRWTRAEVWSFLGRWVRRPRYLRSCALNAPRVNLKGAVVGRVNDMEAEYAARRLARINLRRSWVGQAPLPVSAVEAMRVFRAGAAA